MSDLVSHFGAFAFWVAVGVTLLAGFVKGVAGFAMPLIMISSFSAFLPPEQALAGRDDVEFHVQAARGVDRAEAAMCVA